MAQLELIGSTKNWGFFFGQFLIHKFEAVVSWAACLGFQKNLTDLESSRCKLSKSERIFEIWDTRSSRNGRLKFANQKWTNKNRSNVSSNQKGFDENLGGFYLPTFIFQIRDRHFSSCVSRISTTLSDLESLHREDSKSERLFEIRDTQLEKWPSQMCESKVGK